MEFFYKLRDKLNGRNERSARAIKNIIAMVGLKSIGILCSLIIVPITIDYVSQYEYGLWLTISSLVSWLSFFDFGIGNGLRNKFIEAKEQGKDTLARVYVSTSYAIIGLVVTAVWLVAMPLCFVIDWPSILNADVGLAHVLAWTVAIAITNFGIQFVFSLGRTLLNAVQKPALSSLFDTISQVLMCVVILVLVHSTQGSLVRLALAATCTMGTVLIISNIWCFATILRRYRPSWRFVRFRMARGILSMGVLFFFIQIIAIAFYQTTNLIISHYVGPDEVTVYNIAYKYMQILTMGFTILITPFWSAYAEARVNGDYQWMRGTTRKLVRMVGLLALAGVIMVALSPWAYKIWVGDKLQIPFLITVLVFLFHVCNMWSTLWTQLLFGFGKIRLQTIMSTLCVVTYLPLGIIACRHYGVVGLLSSSIFCFIIYTSWFGIIQVRKLIAGTATGIWNK